MREGGERGEEGWEGQKEVGVRGEGGYQGKEKERGWNGQREGNEREMREEGESGERRR